MSESEEEDYMSEAVLNGIQDVRPGVSKNRQHRRELDLYSRAEASHERMKAQPTRAELEKRKRDEALAKPIGEESKGFALLAKMGYKPGMTLGKQPEARIEPLELQFKADRGGLGHAAEEEGFTKERIEQHMKQMKEKADQQHILLEEYRKRKRTNVDVKQVVGDILKMKKACQELDVQKGLELPTVSWHWPIYKDRTGEINQKPTSMKRRYMNPVADDEDDDLEVKYIYANGKEAAADQRLEELDEDELSDRLFSLTLYLRETHLYCHWCGAKFESDTELKEQCAGDTREAHDE
uniref:G patch domain-containing protein 11 n=1 Tax=Panagrolaimus sp. PS1159 TaxID=55785 RepID=A0AC35G2K3_9BILA